ncbi:transglycosylase domain-containing protein [Pseudomonas typographi]|uniref:transglycosylase domain-containing protein n=1 Tax=Pseudomonas typographi TaxID=2715964 RepID=UPI0016858A65|nr:transglycosylase domain-containing protein [Pseudomonas typographi]MBD1588061.1 penicillin-binding protein [Pseudomonas typographi]
MGVLWNSQPGKPNLSTEQAPAQAPEPGPRRPRRRWPVVALIGTIVVLGGGYAARQEMYNSRLQAREFSRLAASLGWQLRPGASDAVVYPSNGPFDERLGYSHLGAFLERLQKRNYQVLEQVRFSSALQRYANRGLFVPYPEKPQAGLHINDCRGVPIYDFKYPLQLYKQFGDIPPLVVNSLLFIEDRNLLDARRPTLNPAVDWPRFAKAAWSQVAHALGLPGQSAGGSTLATQLEKYRHSPGGLTDSGPEKLRQMFSASVRAYQNGPNTLKARQNVVRDYLNSVPLSAVPGHGEVHGLAEGLRVWYGADFDKTNVILSSQGDDVGSLKARGLALRQVLSLMIAQRRPSHFLSRGHGELNTLTDAHIRLLAGQGIISNEQATYALQSQLHWRDWAKEPTWEPYSNDKATVVTRGRLAGLLDEPLYDLDRLDLTATSSLNAQLQSQASDYLKHLADTTFAQQTGLVGESLLTPSSTEAVKYAFTLFENSGGAARVRVQTDSTDQPFDINEGSKLELGSTAKLRVMTSYLQIIAELHARYSDKNPAELHRLAAGIDPQDRLSHWALDYLGSHRGGSLQGMLDAALERKYSANPGERFFTGGGVHVFGNFRRQDNDRTPTLKQALRESINLPFIRLMRDVVRYTLYQAPNNSAQLLKNDQDPRRQEYLARFADREGTEYLRRFWRKYDGKSGGERLATFLDGLRTTPVRLAAVYRYLFPQAPRAQFDSFIGEHWKATALTPKRLGQLYDQYGPGAYALPDQGYIARVHPLDLWLLGYLLEHPDASLDQALAASTQERQEVYGWLFNSKHQSARDSRIRTMIEIEAFTDIHRRWQQVGYPFDHLVPSLATAIGSSGDRPAALAELVGIILNDGVRLPSLRIDQLHFAQGTPFETRVGAATDRAERVMPVEVAQALRAALGGVVADGTARRVANVFTQPDGTPMAMGGKTGTGDNRIESFGSGGRLVGSRAINRTGTFVFYLGDRYFGTLTAFVPGKASANFHFTSALPVQVLKGMAPILQPYLNAAAGQACKPPAGGPTG